ncbi:DUF5668 domain-containing protein [Paucibacter sp. AS339]|uniref:LiaI-LiaF-like domain-containing protein n=1 Tax=Paucibacter hankyongi TaxID=3133434 RepID=UPI0030B678FB
MRHHHNPQGQVIFGVLLALLGGIFLLDNLHIFNARAILPFWPVVLIVVGFVKLLQPREPAGRVFGLGLIVVGSALLLRHLGLLDFHWRDWWPLLLIGVGLKVILKGRFSDAERGARPDHMQQELLHDKQVNIAVVMSGNQSRVDAQDFSGGDISVVLGAVELDLRQASMAEASTATLRVDVVLGGLELKVPSDWSVSINGTPLLAAFEDKTVPPLVPSKRLMLVGRAVMGGIEVRN